MKKSLPLAGMAALLMAPLFVTTTSYAVNSADIVQDFDNVDSAGNISQLIRSSSNHFWTFIREQGPNADIGEYLKFTGVISGDPHMGNFSIIPVTVDGKRQMRFLNIDFDDAGVGPFAADFARFVVACEATNKEIKKGALIKAYLMGLAGERVEPPKDVAKALDMSVSEYDQLLVDYAEKKSDGGNFKLKKDEIEKYDADISKEAIEKLFPGKKVLDLAIRPQDRGGSAGGLRIWVLVRDEHGDKRIFELKQWKETGLATYAKQPDTAEWLAGVRSTFWPGIDPSSYDLVDIPDAGLFWIREKREALLDIPYTSTKESNVQFLKELSVFDANLIGLIHGRQPDAIAYRAAILKDEHEFHEAIEDIVGLYLEAAEKAFKDQE